MGDNGKKQVEVFVVLQIGIRKDNGKTIVRGDLDNKDVCLNVLADAIKKVTNRKPEPEPMIIQPKPGVSIRGKTYGD